MVFNCRGSLNASLRALTLDCPTLPLVQNLQSTLQIVDCGFKEILNARHLLLVQGSEIQLLIEWQPPIQLELVGIVMKYLIYLSTDLLPIQILKVVPFTCILPHKYN